MVSQMEELLRTRMAYGLMNPLALLIIMQPFLMEQLLLEITRHPQQKTFFILNSTRKRADRHKYSILPQEPTVVSLLRIIRMFFLTFHTLWGLPEVRREEQQTWQINMRSSSTLHRIISTTPEHKPSQTPLVCILTAHLRQAAA